MERVDSGRSQEALGVQFGVRNIRVNCGSTLLKALPRLGLADEIRLVYNPEQVGGVSPETMHAAPTWPLPAG